MAEHGQKTPIIILPNRRIVIGHRRVAAAKLNGWTEITAIVRDDLADDEAAVEELFLKENSLNRQLTPLQQARCAKCLVELARNGELTFSNDVHTKTRDKVGQVLGKSGRQVDRILTVLDTPCEVQAAVEAGYINMTLAGKVKGLRQEDQESIAREIGKRGAEHAKQIIGKRLSPRAATTRSANKVFVDFVNDIKTAYNELGPHVNKVTHIDEDDLEALKGCKALITKLEKRAKES